MRDRLNESGRELSAVISGIIYNIGRERVVSNPNRVLAGPLVFKTRLQTSADHSPWNWHQWKESNPLRAVLETAALPLSYTDIKFQPVNSFVRAAGSVTISD